MNIGKVQYDNIPIPAQLDQVILAAIDKAARENRLIRLRRWVASAAAVFCIWKTVWRRIQKSGIIPLPSRHRLAIMQPSEKPPSLKWTRRAICLLFSPAERLQLRSMASSVFGSSGLLWIRQQIENGCRYLPGMIIIAAASGTACAHDVIVIIPFLK